MLVFQYGSNMSNKRLNGHDRLAGGARRVGIARTCDPCQLYFPVWSRTNGAAAASISPDPEGLQIFGVLYEIPSSLVYRKEAKAHERKSLDAIEAEGKNYIRREISLIHSEGEAISALTYVAKKPGPDLKTSSEYVSHIFTGLAENDMPQAYREYVGSRIVQSNPELADMVKTSLESIKLRSHG
jgi:cation transport regulator ChaC